MNQGRKNSSYESSSQIAFWCMVATMLLVVLLLLFPQVAAKSGIDLDGMDYSYLGEPFWGAEAVSSNIKQVTGIAYVSIKTITGIAIANVKKFIGVE
jgi:hypothetical protein